jgi:hypothetical protein
MDAWWTRCHRFCVPHSSDRARDEQEHEAGVVTAFVLRPDGRCNGIAWAAAGQKNNKKPSDARRFFCVLRAFPGFAGRAHTPISAYMAPLTDKAYRCGDAGS